MNRAALVVCIITMLSACQNSEPNSSGGSSSLTGSSGCCMTCTTGKACGNSCIAKDKTCNKGAGCACNG